MNDKRGSLTTITGAKQALNAIEYVRYATGKQRLEGQQIGFMLLLSTAPEDGMNMQTVSNKLDVDHSFVSRNTKAFGPQMMDEPVVFQRIDASSPKFRLIGLTDHGLKIVHNYIGINKGEVKFNARTGAVTKVKLDKK